MSGFRNKLDFFDIKRSDGGSEFGAEFEQACQDLGIPLFVLPPKNPE